MSQPVSKDKIDRGENDSTGDSVMVVDEKQKVTIDMVWS
jgi:hypothetical protein